MLLLTILYNLLMSGAVALAFGRVRKRRTTREGFQSSALVLGVALLLSILLGLGGRFRVMGLFAYGCFLHVPLALVGTSVLLRRSMRWTATFSSLAAAIVGVAIFSLAIEPFRLEVSELRIESPKVSARVRIALVSDLQTDGVGRYEREVLARVMAEKPDLILLSGDYLQVEEGARRKAVQTELRDALLEVRFGAPLGVFAVAGNVDSPDWPRIFEGLPVVAVESTSRFELPGITLTALSLWDSFDPKLHVPKADSLHLVLGHSPDFALGDVEADLLLAGHTHGGQVRLPFLGPIVTLSGVPRSWAAGMTRLSGSRTLVVSRGIGMERGPAPRLRFLCRPELVLLEIRGADGT